MEPTQSLSRALRVPKQSLNRDLIEPEQRATLGVPYEARQREYYCYTCVRILLYVLILLHVCPHTATYVSSYCYICVLILLHVCPHTATYVPSYCYMCVLILLHTCSEPQGDVGSSKEAPYYCPLHCLLLPQASVFVLLSQSNMQAVVKKLHATVPPAASCKQEAVVV